MARHNETGKAGEEIAANFLLSHGYIIHEKNWRAEKIEIDIIAQCGGEIVIVEVKTRTTDKFGFPEESVTDQKQELLTTGAEIYLEENKIDLPVRFDIISIILSSEKPQIHHIKDAFFISG